MGEDPENNCFRELVGPSNSELRQQSLVEIRVPRGERRTVQREINVVEDLLYGLTGDGEVKIGEEHHPIESGSVVAVPGGMPYTIISSSASGLKVLAFRYSRIDESDQEITG